MSAASAWELAIKYQQGKLGNAANLVSDFSIRIDREGFQLLPISEELGIRAGLLSGPLKDPFDRMLIAQSQAENTPIISNEAILERYGVGRLRWHRLQSVGVRQKTRARNSFSDMVGAHGAAREDWRNPTD